MRYIAVTACLVVVCASVLGAALWQRWLDSEVSPAEYGGLYALRRMNPDLFKE